MRAIFSKRPLTLVYWDSGSGIGRDVTILRDIYLNMGYDLKEVVTRNRTSRWERIGKALMQMPHRLIKRSIQIHIEQIHREQFACAKKNFLFPNPELTDSSVFRKMKQLPTVLCKSRHATDLFQNAGIPTEFVGFTTTDLLDYHVEKDYRKFVLIAGRSRFKGTMAVASIWQLHPEWPMLTIIQSSEDCYGNPIPIPKECHNIKVVQKWLSEDELSDIQNSSGIHLCLSEMEGFGHYILEAMSMRSVVVTTNAPPMNEIVGPDRGVLVDAERIGKSYMSERVTVNPLALEKAIDALIATPVEQLCRMGDRARAWFLENDVDFRFRMRKLFEKP